MALWEDVAIGKGATIVLPLNEPVAPFSNRVGSSADPVGSVTLGLAGMFANSDGSIETLNTSSHVQTYASSGGLNSCSIEGRFATTWGGNNGYMAGNRGGGVGFKLGMGASPVGGGSPGMLFFGIDGDGVWWGVSTDTLWNDGLEHHVVAAFLGTAGQAPSTANMIIVVDGAVQPLTARTYSAPSPPYAATASWTVAGRSTEGAPGRYEGWAVYPNVALTALDANDLYQVASSTQVASEYAGSAALTADATLSAGGVKPREGATLLASSWLRTVPGVARQPWINYALGDGAVQAFEFDTTTGTVLTDKSGNNRHGTLMNTPTLDQPGLFAGEKGIKFTRAQSEYVSLPTAGLPVGAAPYAIELVFKPDLVDAGQGLAQIGRTGTANQGNGVRLGGNSGSAEVWNWWWSNDLGVTGRKVFAGQVYHLVAEFDGTTHRLILNGTVIGERTGTGLNAQPLDPTLARANTTGEYFEGTFYKAAIYPAALGPAKARRNYESVLGGPAATISDPRDVPGLLAWHSAQQVAASNPAEGSTVTTWADQSGKRNHSLSVTGTPVFRSTAGPDSGPCLEFANNAAFTMPQVFSGKPAGYVLMGFRSAGPGLNSGTPVKYGTQVVGGEHFPWSNDLIYAGFGSSSRFDGLTPHARLHSWHRLAMHSAANDWALHQDGIEVYKTTTNGVSWATAPKIGQTDGAAGSWIRLAWAVLLDHVPTAAERTALNRYFTDNPNGGIAASRPITDAPAVTAVGVSDGAYLRWTEVPFAESYAYRVDGEAQVDVGFATSATIPLGPGPHSIEVRGVSAAGNGPWATVTVSASDLYLYDNFERSAAPGSVPSVGSDTIAAAPPVIIGTTGGSYTSGATPNDGLTLESGEPMPTGYGGSRSAWWKYRPKESGSVTIDTGPTTGGNTDTELGVWTAANPSAPTVTALTLVASASDNLAGARSSVTFNAVAGTTYFVQVLAYQGNVMTYGLAVTGPATVDAPGTVHPFGTPPDGGPYTTVSGGTPTITAGYAVATTDDTKVTFPAADDVEVRARVPVGSPSTSSPGVLVRYASNTDVWLLQAEGAANLRLYHRTGTVWDLAASAQMTGWLANGDEEIRLRAHGRYLTAYRNNTPVFTVTDAWWTGAKPTAGIRFGGTTGARITEVTAVPTGVEERPALMPVEETDLTADRNVTARPYKGRDTKALDMESES